LSTTTQKVLVGQEISRACCGPSSSTHPPKLQLVPFQTFEKLSRPTDVQDVAVAHDSQLDEPSVDAGVDQVPDERVTAMLSPVAAQKEALTHEIAHRPSDSDPGMIVVPLDHVAPLNV
jgi:hypothetical protein